MYAVCVTIHVKTGFAEPFLEATLHNARNSRKEPGNLRFDVLRSEDDPNCFFLYEIYRDKEGFADHQRTEHYARWRDAVGDWMAENRTALHCLPLFYGDGDAGP
jgi:autoinducer 2-degrading protein